MPFGFERIEFEPARGKQRLGYEQGIEKAGVGRRGYQCPSFCLGCVGRDADGRARSPAHAGFGLGEAQQLASRRHVAQHAMLERVNDLQRPRNLCLIASGFGTGGDEGRRGIITLEAADRRLVEQDSTAAVDEPGVGRAEIDPEIDRL
jgi:hypothetical protein